MPILQTYAILSAVGFFLFLFRKDRKDFFTIFFVSPIQDKEYGWFIFGLVMIALFSPFTIFSSIKKIFKEDNNDQDNLQNT